MFVKIRIDLIIFYKESIYKLLERIFATDIYLSDESIETYLAIIKEFSRLKKQSNSRLIIAYFLTEKADKSMKKKNKMVK